MVAFHTVVAEINAKKGLLLGARASLQTARALLKQYENVWLKGRLATTQAAIAVIESDYVTALDATQEALACAKRSGSREIRVPALGNFAHLKMLQGSYSDALPAIEELLKVVRPGGGTAIGVLDTKMQTTLAIGDFENAKREAEHLSVISANLESGSSYYGLWHLLTRVRWHYRTGDAAGGLALALDSIPRIERMADRILLERMQLLAAEGLGRTGRAAEGAALMAQAVSANLDPPLEMIAETERVAGRLCAPNDPGAALGHFERAARILLGVGNLTAHAEILRDAAETLSPAAPAAWLTTTSGDDTSTESPTALPPRRPDDLRPPAASLAERIATLVELAPYPPLLASDTLTLIADAGAVQHAAIIATAADGSRELITTWSAPGSPAAVDDHPDAVRIAIGTHRERHYIIAAIPHPSASARATLLSIERLVHAALTMARARQQEREQAALWPEHTPEQQLGLLCASERMLELIKTVRRVANSNVTVLISGETGVGKELFARALHLASPRKDKTFLPFNCTAVPKEMLDSQLFGFRRGAFTGAQEDSPGLIRATTGGTLFLDEIGEMSSDVQPKLLRFLESGEILPLGELRPQLIDVRVVAATNANLEQLVADGRFREDLFYRLNVIPIHIPPLRERREEIPALVEHFLDRFGHELQKPRVRVADDTLEYLLLYRWPGNIRQLANEIRRMVTLAEPGEVLVPSHLSAAIVASRRTVPVQPTEIVMRIDRPLTEATEQLERIAIERALALCGGRTDEAARMLGLSRKGLYLKRNRLGLD
jgi:two-component system response regulator AtoC